MYGLVESEKLEKQNKFLINQLAKTIADNSKVLAEFGMAPPILAKLKSMLTMNISNIGNGEDLSYVEGNNVDDEINLYESRDKALNIVETIWN